MSAVGLAWDLLARDQASPTFLRVASAAERAAVATSKSQRSVENWTAASARTGAKLTKGLTLPLLGLAAVSVDQAAKYQKSLNTIAVATDQSASSMKLAQTQLIAISNRTGTSTSQLSEALYTAAKSGQPMAKALRTVEAAAQGAKAENADLGTVSNALTSIMASYGSKLGDPVKAMNMLVRGSGLAKTTLQDFADSLSNVVPIASSLGIGFDQVAGAIDTMTQHGETAQRATDNLSNLITNLAGQNNVASQSLQSLGVDTIDLSSKLGKRGLTGSLNTVLNAMAKHSKGGLVVTSAFKQAALATASLQTEISAMPPALAKQSKGFADGSVSYKDYLAYAKSLGGQQYAMARGFLGTTTQAQGFNNQLKSGNSTVRTTASTLQKALGGVTGMRTALMLSGESAKTFKGATAAVGEAADSSGKKVLGFAQTQQTAAYKTAAAKVQLQNVSIQLGTVLLPALVKLAETGTKAVHWVDGLSGTDKKLLLWGVGVLAALGPVLSIGARLSLVGRGISVFTTGAAVRLATFAGAEEATATRVGVATGRMSTAFGAAGLGVAVGMLTQNSSRATQAFSVLGSAAAGAALGAAGGPWGIALGAAAGGISALATQYFHLGGKAKSGGDAAKAALAEQKQAADDLYSSLQAVNGAYSQQYKQSIVDKLGSSGALQIGQKAGLAGGQLTDAVLGKGGPRALAAVNVQLENAAASGRISFAQLAKVQGALQTLGPAATAAERRFEAENRELGKSNLTAGELGTSYKKLKSVLSSTGTSLDNQTAAGQRNTAVIGGNVLALNKAAAAQLAHGKSAKSVATSYESQINALELNATKLGLDKKAVDGLIGRYAKVPKSVVTALQQQGIATINPVLVGLLNLYSQVPASKVTRLNVDDNASSQLATIRANLAALHDKTINVDTYVKNTILPSVNADPSDKHGRRKQVGALGYVGYANGGIEDHAPAIYKPISGRVRVFAEPETGGEAYIPLRNDHRRPRAQAIALETVRRLGGVAAFAQGGIGTTSATTVYKVGAGWGFQGQYYGGKTGHKDANSARADYINGQRAAALYHSPESRAQVATDRNSYRSAIASGDVDSTRSAYTTLYADAKAAGANSAALAKLSATEKKVIADLQKRAKITAQVSKATDYLTDLQSKAADLKTSVSGAVTGSFSIATAGQPFQDRAANADSILAELTAKANKAAGFQTLLQTLGREGLDPSLIQQLAEAGPAAYDQAKALSLATPDKIKAINSQNKRLNTAAAGAGSYVSGLVYGTRIDVGKALLHGYDPKKNPKMAAAVRALAASLYGAGKVSGVGLTHGLLGQQKAAGDAAAKLGGEVARQLRVSLGIASPSRVTRELGRHTGVGFALGLTDTVARVSQASGLVGAAGVPSPAPAGSNGGGQITNVYHEWNITEADNGMETHHKIMRRLATVGP